MNALPFAEWFDELDAVTAARVDRYVRRLEAGNFGAAKALRDGVFELRLDFGPGYRVYYGREGKTIIILLGGGSKRQNADMRRRRGTVEADINCAKAKNGTHTRL